MNIKYMYSLTSIFGTSVSQVHRCVKVIWKDQPLFCLFMLWHIYIKQDPPILHLSLLIKKIEREHEELIKY